jgi:hypothetical protein
MNEQVFNFMITHFKFHIDKDETKLLSKSVIYHSEHHNLIYDKVRLREIISTHEWINISYERMLIKNYETMKIYEKLEYKTKRMTFVKTNWISSCEMILVFAFNLRELEYNRDLISKILVHVATRKQICQIERRFEEYLLEYNSIDVNQSKLNNSIVNLLNWFLKAWFNNVNWLKASSSITLTSDWTNWFERAWSKEMKKAHNTVAKEMKNSHKDDDFNSHKNNDFASQRLGSNTDHTKSLIR